MKNILVLILFTICLENAFSQIMIIKKSDGTFQNIAITDAVELYFFKHQPCPDKFYVDYAGKTYSTVQIGSQCWLKENLDVGTMINSVNGGTNSDGNQTNNSIIEKYCYDNDPNNCNTYGGLYQWNEAMQYSTTERAQGICPSGWHIPTENEFNVLKSAVSDNGNALKEIGQGIDDGAGTNTSGFSALLAGSRDGDTKRISAKGYIVFYWASTGDPVLSYVMQLFNNDSSTYLLHNDVKDGCSVRCVKD